MYAGIKGSELKLAYTRTYRSVPLDADFVRPGMYVPMYVYITIIAVTCTGSSTTPVDFQALNDLQKSA